MLLHTHQLNIYLFNHQDHSWMEVLTTRKFSYKTRWYTMMYILLTPRLRLQLAAVPLLDPQHVQQEKIALQKHFKMKRDHVLKRLTKMGLKVDVPPTSTFYIWLNLERLPTPLNNGLVRTFRSILRVSPLLFLLIFLLTSTLFYGGYISLFLHLQM